LINCYYIGNSLTAQALLAQQIWREKYRKHLSKGKALQKNVLGGYTLAYNEQVLIFWISLKKLLYACKENTLKGKKVSKLYLYSIQSIMYEHEKKIRSFTPLLRGLN
jgi:hypothetical protein